LMYSLKKPIKNKNYFKSKIHKHQKQWFKFKKQ
jgi:hypothetical protein